MFQYFVQGTLKLYAADKLMYSAKTFKPLLPFKDNGNVTYVSFRVSVFLMNKKIFKVHPAIRYPCNAFNASLPLIFIINKPERFPFGIKIDGVF